MKTTILSFAAACLFLTANTKVLAQKKEKDKVLVNKVYTIEMTETGGKKPKTAPDEISFKGEKLNSKFISSEHHFPAALYVVTVDSTSDPKTITFTSEGKNSDGEEIKWDGTITGDDVEGTTLITKKGKTKKEYSFTGAIKAKPGKK